MVKATDAQTFPGYDPRGSPRAAQAEYQHRSSVGKSVTDVMGDPSRRLVALATDAAQSKPPTRSIASWQDPCDAGASDVSGMSTEMDLDRFVAAYNRSRFFHGETTGPDASEMERNGIRTEGRDTPMGSSDPSLREPSKKARGPIYLATTYLEMQPYGAAGKQVRVFLGMDRAGRAYQNGRLHLGEDKFRFYDDFKATRESEYLYHDGANANAVAAGVDIDANCVWGGRLSDLCDRSVDDARKRTILNNIGSFMSLGGEQTRELSVCLMNCLHAKRISDCIQDDKAKNTIMTHGLFSVTQGAGPSHAGPATPEPAKRPSRKRSGYCNIL